MVDGLWLACGSRDNNIYVYAVSEGGRKYTKAGKCSVCGWLKIQYIIVYYYIVWKERYSERVFRASWHMVPRPGQWRLRTWDVWKEQSVWWRDGCVEPHWRITKSKKVGGVSKGVWQKNFSGRRNFAQIFLWIENYQKVTNPDKSCKCHTRLVVYFMLLGSSHPTRD